MEELKLLKGDFPADTRIKEAALGDKVADAFFASSDIIGQHVQILGEKYKIKGIIKSSSEIYIPYSEKLAGLTWQKRKIKCNINDKKLFYLKLENLQNRLNSSGAEILDVVVYTEEMNIYKNAAILETAYILTYYLLVFSRRIKDRIIMLTKEYIENHRVVELHSYILNKAYNVFCSLYLCMIVLALLYAVCILTEYLSIPPFVIPDNLFSPASYINVAGVIYERYMARLENGIDGILIDKILVNLVSLFIVTAIFLTDHKIQKVLEVSRIKSEKCKPGAL
jgi:hypothetical protein